MTRPTPARRTVGHVSINGHRVPVQVAGSPQRLAQGFARLLVLAAVQRNGKGKKEKGR